MIFRDLDYPRPQLRRDEYRLLTGAWTLNGSPICVPYPPESKASGFKGEIRNADGKLVYETAFSLPASWAGKHILLHFGAVDQLCDVYLDGTHVGHHKGGYLPFTFNLGCLAEGEHFLKVSATDDLNIAYPYGKQSKSPQGMWYTEVSGIWQHVWIEPVPASYIAALKITPDLTGANIRIFPGGDRKNDGKASLCEITLYAEERGKDQSVEECKEALHQAERPDTSHTEKPAEPLHTRVQKKTLRAGGNAFRIDIGQLFSGCAGHPHLWTPEDPYLYRMDLRFGEDLVHSYFALRTVEVRNRTKDAPPGIFLNGERIFLKGVLDQGYFPDGLYVPDSPEAYARDILLMKELGVNLLRKHAKIEPEQYYYLCDTLGMLVMQDLVNSGPYSLMFDTVLPTVQFHLFPFLAVPKRRIGGLAADLHEAAEEALKLPAKERYRRRFFEYHMRKTLQHLYNHPCVIAYTIFNEGWGQYDSDRLYLLAKMLDASRVYDTASGWFKGKYSDFDSLHVYYRNERVQPAERPLLLSEVGGFQYNAAPEETGTAGSYGYGKCSSPKELRQRIRHMYDGMMAPVKEQGLAGYIFTQLSDVETERNGLYTYDRRICKITGAAVGSAAAGPSEDAPRPSAKPFRMPPAD